MAKKTIKKQVPCGTTKPGERKEFVSSLSEEAKSSFIKRYYDLDKIQKVVDNLDNASIEEKVGAYNLLDEYLNALETEMKAISSSIQQTTLPELKRDLATRSLIDSEDDDVEFITETKDTIIKTSLKEAYDKKLNIDKSFESMSGAKYTKTVVSIDSALVRKALEEDSLESYLKPYVSYRSELITKIRKTVEPKKEEI